MDYPVRVSGDEMSGFYDPADAETPSKLEAYSWGGLTSGSRRHALWLLLLPFALANVAGWMIPGAWAKRPRWRRVHDLLSRILCLLLTALVVSFVAVLVMDIGAWRCRPDSSSCTTRIAALAGERVVLPVNVGLAIALFASFLLVGGLALLARQTRHRYEGAGEQPGIMSDPSSEADITSGAMWHTRLVGKYLGAVHSGVAFGLLGLLGGHAADNSLGTAPVVMGSLAMVAGLSLLVALAVRPALASSGLRFVPPVLGLLAVAVAFGVLLKVPLAGSRMPLGGPIIAFTYATLVTIGVLGALWLLRIPASRTTGKGPSVSLMIVATVMLVAVGSGTVYFAERMLNLTRPVYAAFNWMSVVFTICIAVTSAWVLFRWSPIGSEADRAERIKGRFERLHDVVKRGSSHLRLLGALLFFGTIAALVRGFLIADPRPPFPWVALPPLRHANWGWWLMATPIGVVLLQGLRHRTLQTLIALGGVAGVIVATVAVWQAVPSGGEAKAVSFVTFSRLLVLFLPAAGVVVLIWRARSDRRLRQAVGIAWDLANFWPRWHHPWAPPPYPEIAIPALEERTTALRRSRKGVVVSAHSQGAVLAVPALFRLQLDSADGDKHSPVGFLSYGCLIGSVYRDLFPAYFSDSVVMELKKGLEDRWRNLHRATDPLGDGIQGVEPQGPIDAQPPGFEQPLSHSTYQYNPEYQVHLDAVSGD